MKTKEEKINTLSNLLNDIRYTERNISQIEFSIKKTEIDTCFPDSGFNYIKVSPLEQWKVGEQGNSDGIFVHKSDYKVMLESTLKRYKDKLESLNKELDKVKL